MDDIPLPNEALLGSPRSWSAAFAQRLARITHVRMAELAPWSSPLGGYLHDSIHCLALCPGEPHAMADHMGAFSPINGLTDRHLGTPRNFSDKAGVKLTNIDR